MTGRDRRAPEERRTVEVRERWRLAADERGVVYVEFLLAFPPLFLLFLGLTQLALLQGARLIVQQAAREGVRSAAVILPDPHPRYAGQPPHTLRPKSPAAGPSAGGNRKDSHDSGAVQDLLGTLTGDVLPTVQGVVGWWQTPAAPPRLAVIRRSIYLRLSAMAPSPAQLARTVMAAAKPPSGLGLAGPKPDDDSVADAMGGQHLARLVIGMSLYNDAVTAIRFPREPGGAPVFEQALEPPPALLHLRVTYLYRCSVPLVSALLCDALADLGVDEHTGQIAASQDDPLLQGDLEAIPARDGLAVLAGSGQRFFVLREEASFPYQHAPYAATPDA